MAVKQISDLTVTDRIRSATQFELQDPNNGSGYVTADILTNGVPFDTTTQFAGLTVANVMEVEAATKAGRIVCHPEAAVPGFTVGHYSYCCTDAGYISLGAAAALTDKVVTDISNIWAGLIIVKKINVSLITGALSGTRNGAAASKLWKASGRAGGAGGSTFSPGSQGGVVPFPAASGIGNLGLRTNQPQSMAQVNTVAGTTATVGAYKDVNPLSVVAGGAKNAVGNHFVNAPLYDWFVAEQPIVLTMNQGLSVTFTLPSAVTSQTFDAMVTMLWSEWMPYSPGDR